MRVPVLTLTMAAVLIAGGGAMAQTVEVPVPLVTPGDTGNNHQATGGSNEAGSRQSRYLAKVETLKEKVARTKARDGGQLTPEHEASLKRELDKLNRVYGVTAG